MQGKEGWESNGGQEEWGERRVGGAVESMGWGCR
jgi:hypothetical protein